MTRSELLALLAVAPFSVPGGSSPAPYEMLVLGDSVTWGQGLIDCQKMHQLLVPRIEALTKRTVNPYHYAHSGAAIGVDEFEVVDNGTPPPNWVHEIPHPRATIFQQCNAVAYEHPHQDFDLILVCGGINDVDVTYMFSAIGNAGTIEELTREHCFRHMGALLDRIGAQFVVPSMRPTIVLVLGYYSILGARSRIPSLTALVRAFGARIPTAVTRLKKGGIPISLFQGLLDNSRAFASASTRALGTAVESANRRFATDAFVFVDPRIGEDNAAFTEDCPMIFGMDADGFPQDPVKEQRQADCRWQGRHGFSEFICERASTGHPNQKGAARYAETIFETIAARAARTALLSGRRPSS